MPSTTQLATTAVAAMILLATVPVVSSAATIEVDGIRIKTLSEGVAAAQAADDGPHVINIVTDKLHVADGEVLITEPMTINGDANSNAKKCDILVDVAAIQALPVSAGLPEKGYIEIQTAGRVEINDLKIHPNADGGDVAEELVDGIRLHCPPESTDTAEYVLNRVWVSGSDGNNNDAFIPLESAADLYNQAGVKLWSRQNRKAGQAVIFCGKSQPENSGNIKEAGQYNVTLKNCRAGLSRGPALNIVANRGHHTVDGGLYGHCGTEAVRITGEVVTLTGTPDNHIRLLCAPNSQPEGSAPQKRGKGKKKKRDPSTSNRLLHIALDAHVDLMEYIDAAPLDNAVAIDVSMKAQVDARRDCVVVNDASEIIGSAASSAVASLNWLTPATAWEHAKSSKQNMLLFFYSPDVAQAATLDRMLVSEASAQACLDGFSCARIDVSQDIGDKIAKKYKIFKVPTFLVIAPDAKSFKQVTPKAEDTWQVIEKQLAAD